MLGRRSSSRGRVPPLPLCRAEGSERRTIDWRRGVARRSPPGRHVPPSPGLREGKRVSPLLDANSVQYCIPVKNGVAHSITGSKPGTPRKAGGTCCVQFVSDLNELGDRGASKKTACGPVQYTTLALDTIHYARDQMSDQARSFVPNGRVQTLIQNSSRSSQIKVDRAAPRGRRSQQRSAWHVGYSLPIESVRTKLSKFIHYWRIR